MNLKINKFKKWSLCISSLSACLSFPASAAFNISDIPLSLGSSISPNIMFILDDSGSMHWEFMPEDNMYYAYVLFPNPVGTYGAGSYTNQVPNFDENNLHNYFSRSSHNNAIFYNPDITYLPWVDANNTPMANANPTCALYNPRLPAIGCLNLTAQKTESALWFFNAADQNHNNAWGGTGNYTYWPITYYNYNGGNTALRNSYTRVQITNATSIGTNFTSPGGITRTRDQERQNFANWFTYYRSRVLSARAGVGRSFAQQSTNMRVGFGAINKGSTAIDSGAATTTIINGVRQFSGADRTNFFTSLYEYPIPVANTPLRRALDDAGKYFSRSDNAGPYGSAPGTNSATAHLECRQNYTILTTDGYWNDAGASTPGATANVDGTNGPTITGPATEAQPGGQSFTYSAISPFTDNWSTTLADIAMFYWKNDLRSDLTNRVPTSTLDPAFWQHMVTFGVGLGVTGTVNPDNAFAAISNGSATAWNDPNNSNPAKVDDLLHSGVNSRGGFFSAAKPIEFADKLSGVLQAITKRGKGSATAVSSNSTRIGTDTAIFQTIFDSTDWYGQLLAYQICTKEMAASGTNGCTAEGNVIPGAVWDAGAKVTTQGMANRSLFSFNTTTGLGVTFLQPNITSTLTVAQVDYLRGDRSNEQPNGLGFRARTGNNALLGDLVNSGTTYIGIKNNGYDQLTSTEGETYLEYLNGTAYKTRPAFIAAGANDGMLHVFNAKLTGSGAGEEVFGYVPATILNSLAQLTDPNYTHKFFVDGPTANNDVYFDADNNGVKEWRNVLVGTLGAGGKGIFALDVSFIDPASSDYSASESTFNTSRILWEINNTKAGFGELGYTIGQPSIQRMANGDFAAIFANGYNSASNQAGLYIVNIKTGALIKYISTGVGSAESPNGLSSPSTLDVNGDRIIDAVYAGDAQGNLWKFDVHSTDPNNWAVAFKTGVTPKPLYSAKTSGNLNQPITAKPQAILQPSGGVMILFGTGKYFETGDNAVVANPLVNSFYGIWDTCVKGYPDASNCPTSEPGLSRANLVQQTIDSTTTISGTVTRNISQNLVDFNSKKGWYIDLLAPPSATAMGERVIYPSFIDSDSKVFFNTLTPDANPCTNKPTNWLYFVDALTGSQSVTAIADTNHDNTVDSTDTNVAGIQTDGTTGGPINTSNGTKKVYDNPVTPNPSSNTFDETRTVGRKSWIQLR